MAVPEVRRDIGCSVLTESGLIPSPPHSLPESPAKALSLAMRLESLCVQNGYIGLSAPQIGISSDFFVYWENYPSEPKFFRPLMGCVVMGSGDKFLSLESCATFPGERFGIMRHSFVEISAKTVNADEEGRIRIVDFSGVFSGVQAAVIQHESDHIKGILPSDSGERIYIK